MLGTLGGAAGAAVARPVELWDAFGAGVYLLFGVIHLDLWFRCRHRLGHLWLAGASASALLVDITGMLDRRCEPSAPLWIIALNLFGVAAATVLLFELVSSLSHAPSGRPALALQAFVLLLAPAAGFLLPQLKPVLLLGCFVLLGWAMAKAFKASREGDRDSGMVARGFILLLPDTGKEGAVHVSESVREAVSALATEHEGREIKMTLSLGVAEHRPGRSIEETIAQADAALYQAKEAGRDQVAVL